MRAWLGRMAEDIRSKTAHMDRKQKIEYIAAYYWYHILLTLLGAGLLVLLIRHLFFREPPKEFVCVMVNQKVDYARDEELRGAFSAFSGIAADRIEVDSDYVFSYGDVRLEGANESSYEKFFFRWGSGELDLMLMPESFYRHCRELEYEFADLGQFFAGEAGERRAGAFLEEDGKCAALYADATCLMPYLKQQEGDRILLVCLPASEHAEAVRAFLAFAAKTKE